MELFREHFENIPRLWRMALISVKEEFRGAKLGVVWEILRTLVFFTIYGLFFILIKGKSDINIVLGLFSALLPWQLISTVINQTPRVYKKRKLLVTSIKFPTTTIPTFDIISKFIIHLFTVVIVLLIFGLLGKVSIIYLQLIYYYFALFMFVLALMYTLSIVCSISVDAYKAWQVVTKIFIYLNPIFWTISDLASKTAELGISWVTTIVKLNPFVYILEGFRGTMMHNKLITFDLYFVYFWLAVIALIIVGAFFQKKTRRILPDVI